MTNTIFLTKAKNNLRELIHRRKIYPARFKSYLLDLLHVRIDADYEAKFISKNVVSLQLKKAKEFVKTVEQEISQ